VAAGAAFAFTPEQERQFFCATPTELLGGTSSALGRALGDTSVGQFDAARCPGELLFSTRHELLSAADVRYLRGVLRYDGGGHGGGDSGTTPFAFVPKDAGHFHPLCDPDDVADWITAATGENESVADWSTAVAPGDGRG